MKKAVFITVGFFLLWFTTCAFQMVAMVNKTGGPDRSNAVQVPLFLLVLAIPVVAFVLRRRRGRVLAVLVVVQIGLYVLYETGISIETNIRVDLLLVYPAILVSGWFAFRAASVEVGDQGHAGQSLEAVPSDRTKCDVCGEVFPSHFYLQAGGARGFICKKCAEKP
jgi:hypothetical protein